MEIVRELFCIILKLLSVGFGEIPLPIIIGIGMTDFVGHSLLRGELKNENLSCRTK